MKRSNRVRTPVQRQNAESYLLLTLISFALSVALTRLFLELTGYPQLGNRELHIAHVLWGGLLLFIGALLPLIYANRWAFTTNALLSGVGVGLFIDEVGKFITQNNDYFYPAAAPIIYALFLLTALVYVRLRRKPLDNPRAEFYAAFEGLQEVLDRDLEESERQKLEATLRHIADQPEQPDLARLANELLDFVRRQDVYIAPERQSLWERWQAWLARLEHERVNLRAVRLGLAIALAVLGMVAFARLGVLLSTSFTAPTFDELLAKMAKAQGVTSVGALYAYIIRVALEGITGLMMIAGAGLILASRVQLGLSIGGLGLLIALTMVNLVVFYFDQFATITLATLQLATLLGVRYLQRQEKNR